MGRPVKYQIETLKKFAIDKDGECMSGKYINTHTKLEWKCTYGHKWYASWNAIQYGNWCPVCGNRRKGRKRIHTIERLNQIVNEKGGKILSENFVNRHSKMQFECKNGHQWTIKALYILYDDRWCPKCGAPKRLELKDIKDIAINKGGVCLSDEYINCRNKLKFQCSEGHIWMAQADKVKAGRWCRICSMKNIGLNKRGKKYKPKIINPLS